MIRPLLYLVAAALAALAAVALLAVRAHAGEPSYADARDCAMKSGKPLVVMVSTNWCPACLWMKRHTMPIVKASEEWKAVCYGYVDADDDPEFTRVLIGNGPIPELVIYRKVPAGWVRRVLVGGQSVETVKEFVTNP